MTPAEKSLCLQRGSSKEDVTALSQAIKSQRGCTCPERRLAKEPAFGMSTWAQHGPKWCQSVLPDCHLLEKISSYLWVAVRPSTWDRGRASDFCLSNCCLDVKAWKDKHISSVEVISVANLIWKKNGIKTDCCRSH